MPKYLVAPEDPEPDWVSVEADSARLAAERFASEWVGRMEGWWRVLVRWDKAPVEEIERFVVIVRQVYVTVAMPDPQIRHIAKEE